MSRWLDILDPEDVWDDSVLGVEAGGRHVAVYSVAGVLYATDNLCTHGAGLLCDGFLEGHEIECPLHQGRFDIRSGAPVAGPVDQALRTYPIKVEGGRVFVDLEGTVPP